MTKKTTKKTRTEEGSTMDVNIPPNLDVVNHIVPPQEVQIQQTEQSSQLSTASTSSISQVKVLTDGCLVPIGTVRCPEGLDYVYVPDEMYPHAGIYFVLCNTFFSFSFSCQKIIFYF